MKNKREFDPRFMSWFVYMLKCSDNSFYTGTTTDVERRLQEHNESKKGAAYTRARRPVTLVYQEPCEDRSMALKREHALRKLTRKQKQELVHSFESLV